MEQAKYLLADYWPAEGAANHMPVIKYHFKQRWKDDAMLQDGADLILLRIAVIRLMAEKQLRWYTSQLKSTKLLKLYKLSITIFSLSGDKEKPNMRD